LNDLIRIRKWENFKNLVSKLKPESIVYSIDQHGMSQTKELTALRMILLAKNGYYIYLDFPKGLENKLRETGIPIRKDKNGIRCLEDEDIKQFIEKEFGKDLPVFSFWTT
jgi:hypothetical protein